MKSDGGQGQPRFNSAPQTIGDWTSRGACRSDPSFDQLTTHDAKTVCRTCPVTLDCLRWAMALPPGADPGHVAGGTTKGERMGLRRKHSAALRPQHPADWSRVCPGCEEDLPAEAYGVDRLRLDGLRRYCRVCTSERALAHRQGRQLGEAG